MSQKLALICLYMTFEQNLGGGAKVLSLYKNLEEGMAP